MASSGVFKPEVGIVVLQVVAAVSIGALATAAAFFAVDTGATLLAPVFAALGLLGLTTAARSPLMRVTFDAESLHIVGWFRSRRIPRSAILEIEESDLEYPLVRWALPGEADRWSVLTPLSLGSGALVPASMFRRRHRFLATLRRWAPEVDDDHVRLGLWSRITRGLGALMLAAWDSRAIRIGAALASVALAVAMYWFGWSSLLGVIEGRTEAGRSIAAPAFLSAMAAEGAYWLFPFRRRRPRAWHVVLAVGYTPLAILLGLTFFA